MFGRFKNIRLKINKNFYRVVRYAIHLNVYTHYENTKVELIKHIFFLFFYINVVLKIAKFYVANNNY